MVRMYNIVKEISMKKNIYSLFLALIAMAAFTACSSDDNDYQWATVTGNQVYFSKDLPATVEISMKENSFTVPLYRVNTSEAITVNLTSSDDTGFFNVPSSVSFAAGAKQADIVITYDNTQMVYDEFVPETITIASADYTTIYGPTSYSFSAGALSPYKKLGNGSLVEGYYWGYTTSVEVYQNQENPNQFRIYGATTPVDGGSADPYLEITLIQPGQTIANVTITQSDLVYFADYNTGYHHSTYDADIMWEHVAGFKAGAEESAWTFCRVLDYQENGLPGQIQLAGYYYMEGVGGWNASQTDGAIIINFPGYDPKDYALEATYLGRLTDLDDEDNAQFAIEMGEDVEVVKCAITDGDPDEMAAAIIEGTVETVDLSEAGFVNLPIALTGTYNFVAVAFAGGEAVATAYETVRFTSSHDFMPTYSEIGQGDYVYSVFFGSPEDPQTDPGLTISKSDADEETFKISHWGYDVNFIFKWNRETNEVHVEEAFTGDVHSSYGDVFVGEASDVEPEEWTGGNSYFDPETNTFHFMVAYYVAAGTFNFGEEVYTVAWGPVEDASEGSEARTKARAIKSLKVIGQQNVVKPLNKKHTKNLGLPMMFK